MRAEQVLAHLGAVERMAFGELPERFANRAEALRGLAEHHAERLLGGSFFGLQSSGPWANNSTCPVTNLASRTECDAMAAVRVLALQLASLVERCA